MKYHLVRGAMDLVLALDWSCFYRQRLTVLQGGVGNRITSRSKYGTKKPKTN